MMNMKDLQKAVETYRQLKAEKELLEDQLKAAEREIISYMEEHEKQKEVGENFKVSYSDCTRKTLDSKRLEADLGNLDEYRKVTSYKRLTVN